MVTQWNVLGQVQIPGQDSTCQFLLREHLERIKGRRPSYRKTGLTPNERSGNGQGSLVLRDCKKVLAKLLGVPRPALLIRSPEYRMNQPEPIPLLRSVPGAGQPRRRRPLCKSNSGFLRAGDPTGAFPGSPQTRLYREAAGANDDQGLEPWEQELR